MIAVYEHYFGIFPADCVLNGLCPCEKPRLQTPELHHQTQQRRDDFLARENQHLTQRNQPRRERNLVGNLWTLEDSLAYREYRLDILGTDVHPLCHQSEGR